MAARPVIAVTEPDPSAGFGGRTSWLALRTCLYFSGAKAVRVTPSDPQYKQKFSGLVISGGTDVHPPLYGGAPKEAYRYDHPRDEMEMRWFAQADEQGLPVIGICRGAQMINVARGGSLHMDVHMAYERAKYPTHLVAKIFYRRRIQVAHESLLHQCLRTQSCRVNSMHTQSIDRVGDGLAVTAREKSGVVQAIEDARKPFLLGMQFHPEYMLHSTRIRCIFRRFVAAARDVVI